MYTYYLRSYSRKRKKERERTCRAGPTESGDPDASSGAAKRRPVVLSIPMRCDGRRAAMIRGAASALLLCSPPLPALSLAASKADVSMTNLLPKDLTLYEGDAAPLAHASFECLNIRGKQQVSLSDLARSGKYVVLWFYPEDGSEAANNEKEALYFQRLLRDGKGLPAVGGIGGNELSFDELDAVVLGCSAQPIAAIQQALIDKQLLTIPFISDPRRELISAFGARSPMGSTARQTFVIDPSGNIRWLERNVQFGLGNFNLDNHAARVQRELYIIHNRDGWSI